MKQAMKQVISLKSSVIGNLGLLTKLCAKGK